MTNLEDTINLVVQDFLSNNELFTALDVSNKVKESMPFVRHRETRDVVRAMFVSEIEPRGYGRTTIQVSLPDGSNADALLYHPLADSWDLDAKYDSQKRTQASKRGNMTATVSTPQGSVAVTNQGVTVSSTQPVTGLFAPTSPRDLWGKLFTTQKSIFPKV